MKDLTDNLTIYKVGGCVRDEILGIKSSDNDYVVVGSSVDEMLQLGFIPVGKHFPVFLHPQTHEEYALARTEQKAGIGYHGFTFYTSPQVTLIEDLARRDLTINAIAKDRDNNLIDPFGGVSDLKNRIIRHVSDAFVEDPLRVLRVARFSAKFNFKIAPDTFSLIKKIVASNELTCLPLERVYLEFEKTLDCKFMFNFFSVLYESGALNQVLSEFNPVFAQINTLEKFKTGLDLCTSSNFNYNHKYATIYYFLSTITAPRDILNILEQIPTTNENKTLAILYIKHYKMLANDLNKLDAMQILNLVKQLDYNRKPKQFQNLQSVILANQFDPQTKDLIARNFYFLLLASNKLKQFNYNDLENKTAENINQIKIKLIDDVKQIFYGIL